MTMLLKKILACAPSVGPRPARSIYRMMGALGPPDKEAQAPAGAMLAIWIVDLLNRMEVFTRDPEVRTLVIEEFTVEIKTLEEHILKTMAIENPTAEQKTFEPVRLSIVDDSFVIWTAAHGRVLDTATGECIAAEEFAKKWDLEVRSFNLISWFLNNWKRAQQGDVEVPPEAGSVLLGKA